MCVCVCVCVYICNWKEVKKHLTGRSPPGVEGPHLTVVLPKEKNIYVCVCVIMTSHLSKHINPYPTAFPYRNGMVLHFYQQQESSMTKTVHKVINKGLKTYV